MGQVSRPEAGNSRDSYALACAPWQPLMVQNSLTCTGNLDLLKISRAVELIKIQTPGL